MLCQWKDECRLKMKSLLLTQGGTHLESSGGVNLLASAPREGLWALVLTVIDSVGEGYPMLGNQAQFRLGGICLSSYPLTEISDQTSTHVATPFIILFVIIIIIIILFSPSVLLWQTKWHSQILHQYHEVERH